MKTVLNTLMAIAFLLPLAQVAHAVQKAPGIYGGNNAAAVTVIERRKKRVPGGSGCDDPHDIREHPECRR